MRSVLLVLLTVAQPAIADVGPARQLHLTPQVGEERSASAGSPIFDRGVWSSVPAVVIEAGTSVTGLGAISVKAGEVLEVVRDDKMMVACAKRDGYEYMCLRDKDRDGKFDGKANQSAPLFWLGMKEPVTYRAAPAVEVREEGSFKQSIVFLGMAGQTLRLSYREFTNDLARPAFTEEVTFTLSGNYPENIAYKDLSIDVLGVDNAGLRYVIRKASNSLK